MTKQDTQHLITEQGLKELKKEYDRLINKERPNILQQVSELRSLGDLKENAAYHQARKQQSFIEGRIKELEYIIKNAVISKNKPNKKMIQIGSSITVEVDKQEQKLTLVGENEANFLKGKVSIASPLGKSLLGRKVGEKIIVDAPAGKIVYTIIKIHT